MDRDGVEVHKHEQNKRGQFPASLPKQDWSIKDLLYKIETTLFMRDTVGAQDRVILSARVAYHSQRFGSFFQLMELASHIRSCRTELKKMFGT